MYKKFTHVKIDLPPKLKPKNVDGHRVYETPEGNLYPSVTSILSKLDEEGIKKWRDEVGEALANHISNRATTTGTAMHKIIEDYLNNGDISKHIKLLPVAHFHNLLPHINRIDNILALENSLYSDKLKLAGTPDCIAEFDGIKSIIDFKTSTKQKKEDWIKKYLFQETIYAIMFKERTGIEIDQIVTMISGEDGSSDLFVKDRRTYQEDLEMFLESVS